MSGYWGPQGKTTVEQGGVAGIETTSQVHRQISMHWGMQPAMSGGHQGAGCFGYSFGPSVRCVFEVTDSRVSKGSFPQNTISLGMSVLKVSIYSHE